MVSGQTVYPDSVLWHREPRTLAEPDPCLNGLASEDGTCPTGFSHALEEAAPFPTVWVQSGRAGGLVRLRPGAGSDSQPLAQYAFLNRVLYARRLTDGSSLLIAAERASDPETSGWATHLVWFGADDRVLWTTALAFMRSSLLEDDRRLLRPHVVALAAIGQYAVLLDNAVAVVDLPARKVRAVRSFSDRLPSAPPTSNCVADGAIRQSRYASGLIEVATSRAWFAFEPATLARQGRDCWSFDELGLPIDLRYESDSGALFGTHRTATETSVVRWRALGARPESLATLSDRAQPGTLTLAGDSRLRFVADQADTAKLIAVPSSGGARTETAMPVANTTWEGCVAESARIHCIGRDRNDGSTLYRVVLGLNGESVRQESLRVTARTDSAGNPPKAASLYASGDGQVALLFSPAPESSTAARFELRRYAADSGAEIGRITPTAVAMPANVRSLRSSAGTLYVERANGQVDRYQADNGNALGSTDVRDSVIAASFVRPPFQVRVVAGGVPGAERWVTRVVDLRSSALVDGPVLTRQASPASTPGVTVNENGAAVVVTESEIVGFDSAGLQRWQQGRAGRSFRIAQSGRLFVSESANELRVHEVDLATGALRLVLSEPAGWSLIRADSDLRREAHAYYLLRRTIGQGTQFLLISEATPGAPLRRNEIPPFPISRVVSFGATDGSGGLALFLYVPGGASLENRLLYARPEDGAIAWSQPRPSGDSLVPWVAYRDSNGDLLLYEATNGQPNLADFSWNGWRRYSASGVDLGLHVLGIGDHTQRAQFPVYGWNNQRLLVVPEFGLFRASPPASVVSSDFFASDIALIKPPGASLSADLSLNLNVDAQGLVIEITNPTAQPIGLVRFGAHAVAPFEGFACTLALVSLAVDAMSLDASVELAANQSLRCSAQWTNCAFPEAGKVQAFAYPQYSVLDTDFSNNYRIASRSQGFDVPRTWTGLNNCRPRYQRGVAAR